MKPPLAVRLGACVRRLRLERGWSQVEFGERCGFYQTYLSRVERGTANPTLNAIEVIGNALGMDVFRLFEEVKATNVITEHTSRSPKRQKST